MNQTALKEIQPVSHSRYPRSQGQQSGSEFNRWMQHTIDIFIKHDNR